MAVIDEDFQTCLSKRATGFGCHSENKKTRYNYEYVGINQN